MTGAHSLDDLGLLPAVADDHDVGDVLTRRYLLPLRDSDARGEIAQAVRVWLEESMNVDRSAERLIIHANTVRCRLARFEELAQSSLKDARTIAEVLWTLDHARATG